MFSQNCGNLLIKNILFILGSNSHKNATRRLFISFFFFLIVVWVTGGMNEKNSFHSIPRLGVVIT